MSEKLGLPYDGSKMENFAEDYAQIIKDHPDQIRFAAMDSEKAITHMTTLDFKRVPRQEQQQNRQQGQQRESDQNRTQQEPARHEAKAPGRNNRNKGTER